MLGSILQNTPAEAWCTTSAQTSYNIDECCMDETEHVLIVMPVWVSCIRESETVMHDVWMWNCITTLSPAGKIGCVTWPYVDAQQEALTERPKCLYDGDHDKHWCIERTTQMFV